jgi:hypothetical protein
MLKMIQRFGKHFCCHLQGEYIMVGYFGSLILGRPTLPLHQSAPSNPNLHLLLAKTPKHYTITLKMTTTIFAETLDNFRHSTRLNPESRRFTSTHILLSLTNMIISLIV